MPLGKYLDPERDKARRSTQAGASRPGYRPGNIWDSVRQEFRNMRQAPLGRIVEGSIRETGRGAAMWAGAAGTGVKQYGRFVGSPMFEGAGESAESYWRSKYAQPASQGPAPAVDKGRRLQMAGVPPPRGTEPYQPMRPESAVYGSASTEAAPPGSAMKEPKLDGVPDKGSKTGPMAPPASRVAPIRTAPADEAFMQQRTDDPRTRYLQMAGMSLEDREKFLSSLPEGQRPIHTIRGTQQGWYSPGMSKEFATLPEAVTGVAGQPTLASEQDREQKALDRIAGTEKQRFASEKGAEAAITSAQVRAQATRDAANIAAEASKSNAAMRAKSGKGGEPEEWMPVDSGEETVLYDKKSGKQIPIIIGEAQNIATVYRNLEKTSYGRAALNLEGMNRDVRNEVVKYLPSKMQEYMYNFFKARSKKEEK